MTREMEYNEKSSTLIRSIISRKLNAKMTPLRVFRISKAAISKDIIDCIGK